MKKSLLFLLILAHVLWGGEFLFAQQSLKIEGVVTGSADNAPVAYATVAVKNSSLGTITSDNGHFALPAVPEGATLVVSCIGYTPKEVTVSAAATNLNIALDADVIALDAVVAVGYGTMKRSDITGAVASVSAEDLKASPVATVDQAMQGRIAGVTVNSGSGQPGQAAEVRIRGIGTVNNSAPIYVVDGIITEDIGFLNSGDIESMEVLKDASSTAIYGSRGANGVIIITTKSGGDGRVNVSFDAYYGIQNMARTLDLMGRDEFVNTIVKISGDDDQRKELKRGFNTWLGTYRLGKTSYYPSQESLDFSRIDTDWQREVQKRNAGIQNYHLSVDGGTDKVKYSLSAGYFDQQGTIRNSYYNRLTLRSNVSYQIAKWLKVSTNISYITARSRSLGNNAEINGVLYQAIAMAPWDPTHYPAGTLSYAGEDIGGKIAASTNFRNVYNPFTQLETSHPNNSDERLMGNVAVEIKPWKWLTWRSSVSMNRYYSQSRTFRDEYFFSDYDKNDYNSVGASMYRSTEMFYEHTLTFAKKFNDKHDVSLMVGQTTEEFNYYTLSGGGANLSSTDPNLWYVSQTTLNQTVGDGAGRTRRLSFLGRFFYSYDNRYLLTVNFRADGSSKFPEHPWGYFPSAALAWRISEESFLKGSAVSNLKLRLSWGQIGNDKISEGAFTQAITQNNFVFVAYPFGPTTMTADKGNTVYGQTLKPGAAVTTFVNTGGRWELTEQWDVGVDFGFWGNKLYGTVDGYVRDTRDMLLSVPAPAVVGNMFSAQANVGTVRNKGIELSLGHANQVRDFSYDINANVSFVKNELTHLNGGERVYGSYSICDEGLPLWSFWGYEYEGLYRTDAEVVEHQYNIEPNALTEHAGDARYKDQNNDGVIDLKDQVKIGNPFPWLTYGINISLGWKGIDLTMFFQGVYGNQIYNALRMRTEGDGTQTTLSTRMRDVWTPSTPDGTIPNPGASGSARNFEASSRFIEDGSYFRLKNLQIGYTLPQHVTRKFYVSRWRFYISASNLFTATKYSGYDPEVGGGVDWGNYPQARTVLFGTSINF